MPRSFPLRWKILLWFFVNLALIALGVFLLFRAQFRVGIDSLLNGPTGDRLEALARPLAAELRTLPRTQWGTKRWVAAFERATAGWRERGLQAALVRNDGLLVAGEVPALPPEIRQVLENFDRRKRAGFGPGPPMMRGGGNGGGGGGGNERDRDRPGGGWGGLRGFGPGGMGFERRGGTGSPGSGPDKNGEFWEAREIRPQGPPSGPAPRGGDNGPAGTGTWSGLDGKPASGIPRSNAKGHDGTSIASPPAPPAGSGLLPDQNPPPAPEISPAPTGGNGEPPAAPGPPTAPTAPTTPVPPVPPVPPASSFSGAGNESGSPPTGQGSRPPSPDAGAGFGLPDRMPAPMPEGDGGRERRWPWPPFPEGFDPSSGPRRLQFAPRPELQVSDAGGGGSGTPVYGPLQKFMLVAGSPRTYWAGVHLDGAALTSPEPGPLPFTLLIASSSLRGGGLFFDYLPWLVLGGVLLTGSVLLWLPFVQGLTKALGGLTNSAEAIARGQFEPPPVSGRRDELGRLQRAHRDMAARLEGFVTGQKRFLGDTAHELLSPIARLEVGLSILETRVADEDARYIDRALGEVRQMSALVQDLLSFTKAGLRRPDVLPQSAVLADLAHEAVERETADTGPEVEVNVSIPGDLEVLALPSLLSRAIGNVVRNAVRYAAADGPIVLTAETRASGSHGGDGEDGRESVILTISDHGPGVPEEALPRLFDPFYRPDTSRAQSTGGTGLGLAIVKTAVEACGGTVSVRNGAPRGLVVEMVLRRSGAHGS